jgi:hypothetical protein
MTAMSVVPPMSTTMEPVASVMAGRRRWRAIGSSDQVHFAGLGAVGAVDHGAAFDLRDASTGCR